MTALSFNTLAADETEAKADTPQDNAAPATKVNKDKSKHYHPRDGK